METTVNSRDGFPSDDEISRDYRILRVLGRGGMGEVYLAEQLRVGRRRIALKLIRPPYTHDGDVVRRFENEASVAGRLDHENVVKIHDCRTTSAGRVYVAMEYVDGRTLRGFLSERGALPLLTALDIAKQVCSGLEAAHRAGIVHRDVKPDNIMLIEKDGRLTVKLLDFGIARLAGADVALTSSGAVLGSASYMAPEQAEGLTGDRIDARADVYSTAMVIYEMLTGIAPLKSNSWAEAVHKQRYEIPPPPSSYNPGLPAAVDQVLLKALSKNREQRHQSVMALYDELQSACGQGASPHLPPANLQGQPVVLPVPSPSPGGAQQLQGVAGLQGDAPGEHLSAITRMRMSWSMLPKALKWILVIILIPLLINLFTDWRGADIIAWFERVIGHTRPGPTVNGPPPLPSPTATRPPALIEFMQYRAVLETPRAGLDTLPADNEIRSGEAVHFLVRLTRPGSLYLLHERDDGYLEWVNRTAQDGRAGEWLQVPENEDQVIAVDDKPGVEKFLLIYVPRGSDWTLAKAINPQPVIGEEGVPTIPKEAAAALRDSVRSAGVEMSSTADRLGRAVTHKLIAPDEKEKLAFHEFRLNHTR